MFSFPHVTRFAGGPADQTYKEGAPLVLDLHGTRHQIGWDYAALMHTETNEVYMSFISSVFPSSKDQALLAKVRYSTTRVVAFSFTTTVPPCFFVVIS